jgi:hypothetical protein
MAKLVDHLAGIVPLAYQPMEFNFPWHDYMLPLANGYTVAERAVYEAATAGCDTIWVVAYKTLSPYIRKQIGNECVDPITVSRVFYSLDEEIREIPVYYVAVHTNDLGLRDSMAWSAVYGCLIANQSTSKLSEWVSPENFYISMPHGVTSLRSIKKHRKEFYVADRPAFMSYEGKTALDGLKLGFSMTYEDARRCQRFIMEYGTKGDKANYSDARLLTTQQVFANIDRTNEVIKPVESHHTIDSWDNYCKFMASDFPRYIKKPGTVTHTVKRLGYQEMSETQKQHELAAMEY